MNHELRAKTVFEWISRSLAIGVIDILGGVHNKLAQIFEIKLSGLRIFPIIRKLRNHRSQASLEVGHLPFVTKWELDPRS